MKISAKAALLSAFIFPGAGHFYLKKKMPGMVLFVITFWSLYVLLSSVFGIATEISDEIINGSVMPTVSELRKLIALKQSQAETQPIMNATIILLVAWLVGVIDSYRVGRQSEVDETAL